MTIQMSTLILENVELEQSSQQLFDQLFCPSGLLMQWASGARANVPRSMWSPYGTVSDTELGFASDEASEIDIEMPSVLVTTPIMSRDSSPHGIMARSADSVASATSSITAIKLGLSPCVMAPHFEPTMENLQQRINGFSGRNQYQSHDLDSYEQEKDNLPNIGNNSNDLHWTETPAQMLYPAHPAVTSEQHVLHVQSELQVQAREHTSIPQVLQEQTLMPQTMRTRTDLQSETRTQKQHRGQDHNGTQEKDRTSAQFINVKELPTGPSGSMQLDFEGISQRIWRFNDQRASLFLQERLKAAIPGEYELLVGAITRNLSKLMTHRFGNFLVQCMVQMAKPEDLDRFASTLHNRIVKHSMDPFCCHVIQKLLDVSPLPVQMRVASELLEGVVPTMINPSGSHVWQKLLHLPWPENLPSITLLVHEGVHKHSERGWLAVIQTHAGCAAIKSFLGVSSAGPERQVCLEELMMDIDSLMFYPSASALVVRLAMISTSRARTLSHILSRAYEYAIDTNASTVLISLLHRKIPGFSSRLHNALSGFQMEVSESLSGRQVWAALESLRLDKK